MLTDLDIQTIRTGFPALDGAIRPTGGGFPCGRITLVYGPDEALLSRVMLASIASVQHRPDAAVFGHATVALLDCARAYVPNSGGTSAERMLVSQPDSSRLAFEIAEMIVRSGVVDLLVIDRVTSLVDPQDPATLARLSTGVRTIASCAYRTGTPVVFFLPASSTAVRFYASVIVHVAPCRDEGDDVLPDRASVTVQKNKLADPFARAQLDLSGGSA